jgi:hypothetical protein
MRYCAHDACDDDDDNNSNNNNSCLFMFIYVQTQQPGSQNNNIIIIKEIIIKCNHTSKENNVKYINKRKGIPHLYNIQVISVSPPIISHVSNHFTILQFD